MCTPQTFANLNPRHLSVSMWICPIISACHIFQLLKHLVDFNKILWDILTEKYQPIKAVTLLETKINCCTYSIGCTSNWETFISWLNTDKINVYQQHAVWMIHFWRFNFTSDTDCSTNTWHTFRQFNPFLPNAQYSGRPLNVAKRRTSTIVVANR